MRMISLISRRGRRKFSGGCILSIDTGQSKRPNRMKSRIMLSSRRDYDAAKPK